MHGKLYRPNKFRFLFSDQVQNTEESSEEYHQFCATMKKEIVIQTRRRQRRKLTIQLTPECTRET